MSTLASVLHSHVVVRPATAGPWFDRARAEELRKEQFPPTAPQSPVLLVVDLNDVYPTPDVLEAYLVPLAQEIKAGQRGEQRLVVRSANAAVRHTIAYLAAAYGLSIYVSSSMNAAALTAAEPVGELTPTDKETLEAIEAVGGRTDASALATRLGIRHTAALNRLAGLARKGLLHRVPSAGRNGDLFVDPRFPDPAQTVEQLITAVKNAVPADEAARTERILARTVSPDRQAHEEPEAY